MSITIKDLKDSLNPLKPKKYLKARLKIAPFIIIICSLIALAMVIIQLVVDPKSILN